MAQTSRQFRDKLRDLLAKTEDLGFVAVEVKSGQLHRQVGGYPGQDHRMPICCEVMYSEMKQSDEVVSQPKSGKGASLLIRYKLPH